MRTILLVARREIVTMLRRPSFYIGASIVPVIIAALTFGLSFIGDEFGGDPGGASGGPTVGAARSGYVDQAGILTEVPDAYAASLQRFPDEAEATAALRAGTVESYFVIAPTYRADGQVTRVSQQTTFTSASAPDTQSMTDLLRLNLTGDARLAERLAAPLSINLEIVDSANGDTSGVDRSGFSFALATLLMFAIVNGGGWLIQAVAEEKENRTIELVLTSVRPFFLMTGKLLGLGAISLVQLVVWLVLGAAIARGGGGGLAAIAGDISLATMVWALLYFLLGFLLLGSLMMALGAVGASVRESGQLSSALTLPVIVPIWFGSAIIDQPDSLFSRILSFIPLTAPVTMMLRLGVGSVAAWQLILSIVLLALSVAGAVWMAARLFRASTLLTGVKPTVRVIWQALRG